MNIGQGAHIGREYLTTVRRGLLLLGKGCSSSCVAVNGDGGELLACSGQQDVRKAVAHVYLTSRACSNRCFLYFPFPKSGCVVATVRGRSSVIQCNDLQSHSTGVSVAMRFHSQV